MNFGFSKQIVQYKHRSIFDLKVGLKVPIYSKDPLEAFSIFFNQTFETILVSNAKLKHNKKFPIVNINRELLYKYIGFLIFSGIVNLPQEKLYFSQDDIFSSVFKKENRIISRDELKFCKSAFSCDRQTLSNIDNKILSKVWNSSQLSIVINEN